MKFFMPLFLLVVGYTTIIAYFCVGMKCARFLFPKRGEKLYILFAVASFIFYSFFDQTHALLVMSLSSALLISFNLLGIYRLRHEILPVAEPAQQQ
jgi:AGCS family alanine or glycine:cation symporter